MDRAQKCIGDFDDWVVMGSSYRTYGVTDGHVARDVISRRWRSAGRWSVLATIAASW